jgi:hypothetical protein
VILPNDDKAESVAVAEKDRSLVAFQQFRVGDKIETITISGGVARIFWPSNLLIHPSITYHHPVRAQKAKQPAARGRGL